MSPFLAEVNVINVTGDASPSASNDHSAVAARFRADLKQIEADTKSQVDAAIAKAQQDGYNAEQNTKHHNGTFSISVDTGKSKSSDEDMVFAAIPIVAIVFTFLYLIIRALMAPFTNRNKRGAQPPVVMEGLGAEESALLEKLQRTLTQMESRVESLETILIDPTHTKEKYGQKL